MRLLKRTASGQLSLTEDLADNDIPEYAILSHTWGAPEEEVSFEDIIKGTGESKVGYKKIQFCGEQATLGGLEYLWVDTCCIDKSKHGELPKAINSMFRWYRNAARCYVFLSDVSTSPPGTSSESDEQPWAQAFRESRWFKRGWTLQELLAPASVEFFSKDCKKLGNKESLEREICDITEISPRALQGVPLHQFTVGERFSWTAYRETKIMEDSVYSLLGVFGVEMLPLYGEGREEAFNRLNERIESDLKEAQFRDFTLHFSLSDASEVENFVAREKELTEMHKILRCDGNRRVTVLQGLGGIGKTQLAIAYAKRFKHSYSAVLWINIRDEDSVRQSFIVSARRILRQHPSASRLSSMDIKKNSDEVIDAVREWLSVPENTRWLVVYDNYDNPNIPGSTDPMALDIRKYLPEPYQGSIIVTTRSAEVEIGHLIPVQKLKNIDDSLKILSNTSKRENLANGKESRIYTICTNLMIDADAILLAKELDGLPLALATTGAYLKQITTSFSVYLREYKASWRKLQKRSPQIRSYEDRKLYSTWQITLERVKRQNELSAKLLQLWAYFDNRDIWFELLRHSNSDDPEWIQELTEDEISFSSALRVLCNHGLVEADSSSPEMVESKGYSIHSCVHSWTKHILNQEWNFDLAKIALKLIGSHVPMTSTDKWWLIQQRLLQHAARCLYVQSTNEAAGYGISTPIHNLARLYADQGKLDIAETLYERALEGKENELGAEHASTLDTVNNLGLLYTGQGELDNAEKMYQRALQGYEKALGADHIKTLNTVNNLGRLYRAQSKLDEAKKMYWRALKGREQVLGADNSSTLDTVNDLGILYTDQGKLDEAEMMYQRALQGYNNALGADHTSTLSTVNNLGNLYRSQGRLNEAEVMYLQAMDGREKSLGKEHILTLQVVNNLGVLYTDQGKLDDAEIMHQRALEGKEKVLGPDHISTLQTVNNLGVLYRDQGRLDDAETMYQRALQGREKALGKEHASTLETVNNLGTIYRDKGKLDKAEMMFRRAMQGFERTLGTHHASTRTTANNLSKLKRE